MMDVFLLGVLVFGQETAENCNAEVPQVVVVATAVVQKPQTGPTAGVRNAT